jgi:hypothetical protein
MKRTFALIITALFIYEAAYSQAGPGAVHTSSVEAPTDFAADCSAIFEEFNRTSGPNLEALGLKTGVIFEKAEGENMTEQELYYLLANHILCALDTPLRRLVTISALVDKLRESHLFVPPLVMLFFGESLIRNGETLNALAVFQNVIRFDGHFPIIDYYVAHLTDRLNGTEANLSEFSRNNPGFWALAE